MGVDNNTEYDTVAHEYTHSVLGAIVDLDDFGEAGALNEAYADIMGELAENDLTWTHGDRVLSNPDINNYPSYYKGEFWCDSSNDSKVVHTNCTVIGHAAYLMSKYGKISNDRLANIWYASIKFLKPDSNFHDCKTAVIKAANKLNCDEDTIDVINSAFYEVGIYDGKGTVRGIICEDNSNTSLPNVTVRFNSGFLNYSTKTNSTGNFKIELPAGTWEISVEDTDTHWCHEKRTITVEKGEEITITPPFYMKKGAKVQGYVLDSATKAPIANATVEVFDNSDVNIMKGVDGTYDYADFKKCELVTSTTTDENGKYTLNLQAEKNYAIAVNCENYKFNGLLFYLEKGLDGYFPADILLVPNDDGDDDRPVTASGDCGANAKWMLYEDGELVISGSGEMYDFSYSGNNKSPFAGNDNIKNVIIEDGVTSIGNYAFNDCKSLTSIKIPNSITSVGNYVFQGCCNLASITIPDSVKSIGLAAFFNCNSLISVTISNSIKEIEASVFRGCSSLTSITIPDSVTSIGYAAFSDCSSLSSVIIPNRVTKIGRLAFNSCDSLTSITIPKSVTSVGVGAFGRCKSLTNIKVNENNKNYSSDEYGALFDKYKTELIQYPASNRKTEYTISDSVKRISDCAFIGCSNLTSITIPNSVMRIGDSAFRDCKNLASIIISNSVKSIGDDTFYNCSSLTSITLPNSVTRIGESAFYNCSSLIGIAIPNSITSIGEYAFGICKSLTSIIIPDSVTNIGDYVFAFCSSLTSVTIPSSVTSIGHAAFWECQSLTSITIPDSVTSIGSSAFSNCSSLTIITIPNSVTIIGAAAFFGCVN